jgi:hypothetical protein
MRERMFTPGMTAGSSLFTTPARSAMLRSDASSRREHFIIATCDNPNLTLFRNQEFLGPTESQLVCSSVGHSSLPNLEN